MVYWRSLSSGATARTRSVCGTGSHNERSKTSSPLRASKIGVGRVSITLSVNHNAVISPAVPPDGGLIRTSLMATHTEDQLDRVLEIFEKVGKALGII